MPSISQPHVAARRPHRRTDDVIRPAHAADIAQARVFDTVLRGEIAELEEILAGMERRWLTRCESGSDDPHRPPQALVRMRGRVAEAQKMLEALRSRFPHE